MVDRATCGMLATDGENLYREDLAKDLKVYFQDILDARKSRGLTTRTRCSAVTLAGMACLLVCVFAFLSLC